MEVAAAIAPVKKAKLWLKPALLASVLIHLLFAAVAGVYVVSRYTAERKLTFQGGPKSPNPRRARVAASRAGGETDAGAEPAGRRCEARAHYWFGQSFVARNARPADAEDVGERAEDGGQRGSGVNFNAAAVPMGSGALGGTGSGAPVTFFGIRDVSTSVVIMIDVSNSMFSRTGDAEGSKLVKLGKEQSFQAVRDEAIKLVQSLSAGTQFGIVRWSGGAYPWKSELVPATEANKAAAIAHIQSDVDFNKAKKKPDRPGGTRHDYALEEAFKLKPETIYMITDGNATGRSASDPSKKNRARRYLPRCR